MVDFRLFWVKEPRHSEKKAKKRYTSNVTRVSRGRVAVSKYLRESKTPHSVQDTRVVSASQPQKKTAFV